MACFMDIPGPSLITELNDLVNQIGNSCDTCPSRPPCSGCPPPCCYPCTFPFAQVTMTCPPPVLAPTRPEPVKPLQLPCPQPPPTPIISEEEREVNRYDNFYNNYNIDWHNDSPRYKPARPQCTLAKQRGQTVDGKSPCCNECMKPCDDGSLPGCPTGFKPCTMKLTAPPCCDPCGIWFAEIQPCPPKPRKSKRYDPPLGDSGECCKK